MPSLSNFWRFKRFHGRCGYRAAKTVPTSIYNVNQQVQTQLLTSSKSSECTKRKIYIHKSDDEIPIVASRKANGTINHIMCWWVGDRESNPAISNINPAWELLISVWVSTGYPCGFPRKKQRRQIRKNLTWWQLSGRAWKFWSPCLSKSWKAKVCCPNSYTWII